jgi:hypothetical protein
VKGKLKESTGGITRDCREVNKAAAAIIIIIIIMMIIISLTQV